MSTISRNSWHYKFAKAIPVFQAHKARGLCNYVRRLVVQFSLCGLLLFMEARLVWDVISGWHISKVPTFLQFLHILSDAFALVVFAAIVTIAIINFLVIPAGRRIDEMHTKWQARRRTRSGNLPLSKRAQRRLKIEILATTLFETRYREWMKDTTGTLPRVSWEECYKEAKMQFATPFYRMMVEYSEAIHNKLCPTLEFKD